jgi:DNA-binding NtrC family response regulator
MTGESIARVEEDAELLATRTRVIGGRAQRRLRTYRLVVDTPNHPREEHIHRATRITAGTREENDIVIADESVSRAHFEISLDDRGYRLRDLESTNGTLVDGYRINDGYLRAGSVIRVGRTAITFSPLGEEVDVPASDDASFGPIVGKSLPMRELYALLAKAAPTPATVLIEGETGSGKELVARAVHEASPRAKAPFVVFDCASVPRTLMESELLGHEKGAFTGAMQAHAGALEQADGGTLFLDELGELPIDLQPKLLRALQQRVVRRLGGTEEKTVDVRIVAATNRDLVREINRGTFRDDLYFRLAVVRVRVPPLRERLDDLRLLANRFIRLDVEDAARAERFAGAIDDDEWRRLRRHPWPGNVRELRNVVTRTVVLSIDDPHPKFAFEAPPPILVPDADSVDLDRPFVEQKEEVLAKFEASYLLGQLARHGGNMSAAARAAGLDRMYFKRLVKKHPR